MTVARERLRRVELDRIGGCSRETNHTVTTGHFYLVTDLVTCDLAEIFQKESDLGYVELDWILQHV